jgi:site-specific recombinase XerD
MLVSRTPRPNRHLSDDPRTSAESADVTLAYAVEQTLSLWTDMTSRGQMSLQTNRSFGQLLERYQRYAQSRHVLALDAVTADLAEDFVFAQGRTRHGRIGESATATMHQRRAVLRSLYRALRELGLTDADPTRDIILPERAHTLIRPLDEDEAVALRHAAEYVARPSRHAAAAALALSGGHSGEIGHARIRDLDRTAIAVWMHGSSRTEPRWCPLDPWALRVLLTRAAFVEKQQRTEANVPDARLAVSSAPAPDEQIQARARVALSDLIRRIGLGNEPQAKPASLTAYAAMQIFDTSGSIEEVARRLGLRSLDRAAHIVGYDWTQSATEQQGAHA